MLYFAFCGLTLAHLTCWKDIVAMPRARRSLMTGFVGAFSLSAAIVGLSVAQAAPQPATSPTTAVAAGAQMPSAVEDFAYPGADRILQEQKITLKRGDGRIMLTSCDAPHDIMIKSRTGVGDFCFAVSGNKGYLTMNLPAAFGIWTEDHPVQAKITADGKETVVNAPKNDYKPFGEAGGSAQSSVLVELRVTG
ncbi:hypothetical protein [Streptomyces rimosus]|uniref:hypothetical protein n=1 Tax=Streptomyces rimosus TaxID=1927 RepID=UPI0037A7B60C